MTTRRRKKKSRKRRQKSILDNLPRGPTYRLDHSDNQLGFDSFELI